MSIPPTINVHSQEGWVVKGASQRRPGLHVDSPGEVIPCSWKESFFFRKSEYKESIKRCRKHWKREKRRGKLLCRRRRRLTALQLSWMGTWLLPLRHTHQRGRQVKSPVLLFILFKGTVSTVRTVMFCKAESTWPLTLPILQKCGIAGSTPVKLEGLIWHRESVRKYFKLLTLKFLKFSLVAFFFSDWAMLNICGISCLSQGWSWNQKGCIGWQIGRWQIPLSIFLFLPEHHTRVYHWRRALSDSSSDLLPQR